MSSLPPQPTTLDDLEDAVLELIFAYACSVPHPHGTGVSVCYRHNSAIPIVCRRWQACYVQSALLWQEVRIDWAVLAKQAPPSGAGGAHTHAAFSAAAAWLSARLPYAQRLLFRGCHALAPPTEALPLGQLFPGGLCSPRLKEARFLDAWGSCGAELLAVLRRCPALRSASLACQPRAQGREAALAVQGQLLVDLACLPALSSLELHVDKIAGSLAELAAALPGLTHLSLCCRMESAALAPELLEGLSQLRRLELENVRLAQFTPRLAQALSQLTHLSCADVLAAQPRRRAGVQLWQGLRHLASLRELRLERQAGAGMPANALACRRLQGLTLVGCEAGEWPASPYQLTGEGGCLGSLASLHLESLHLPAPVPAALWRHLSAGLTSLTWRCLLHSVPQVELLMPGEGPHIHMQARGGGGRPCWACAQFPPIPCLAVPLLQPMDVPAELAHLQGLQELRLEYCGLDALPPALQALTRLTLLSLEGNRISALPAWRLLTGLQRLSLANNGLAKGLTEGLTACSSLQELSLEGDCLSLGAEAAHQLARALPQRCTLRVSLVPAHGRMLPAEDEGQGPAEAAAAPMQFEGGAHGAGDAVDDQAAQQAQQAALAAVPALEAHLASLQQLRRALGGRLIVDDAAAFRS
ncbi:hypothetical protein ABPG75_002581 [Micractinium tetrahymenae]